MTNKKLLIVAIFFFVLSIIFGYFSVARAEWTPKEKGLFGAYVILSGIDAIQSNDMEYEYNPLLRDRHGRPDMEKVITAKVLSGLIVYGIADRWPEIRGEVLWFAVGIQGITAGFNY